jgi:glutamyl-tRNA reductase
LLQQHLTDADLPANRTVAEHAENQLPNDLERLVVLAGTFHDLPTDERELLAERLDQLHDGFAERMLLHTCHRAELIGVLEEPADAGAEIQGWRGTDAIERVFTVAAGLDSAVVAEEQLLGQVRDAYSVALARGETGPILNELLRRALRFGKHVRASATPGGDGSLALRAVAWIDEQSVDATAPEALVVGSGTVARQLATALAARGYRCTIASRSVERGERLVSLLPGDAGHGAMVFAGTLPRPVATQPAVIALATRVSGPILEWAPKASLVVDLCAPAGVAAAVRDELGDRLLDLDRLNETITHLTPSTERRLRRELTDERDRFIAWLEERRNADGIARLRRHAGELAQRHLDRLRGQSDLRDDQLAAVERMTRALVAELLHEPTVHLRQADDAGHDVERIFGLGVAGSAVR